MCRRCRNRNRLVAAAALLHPHDTPWQNRALDDEVSEDNRRVVLVPCVPHACIRAYKHSSIKFRAVVFAQYSKRHIDLDSAGYFIIYVDREEQEIVAKHYTNIINKNGVACDPDTGKPIPCSAGYVRPPSTIFRARTAKELQIRIFEDENQNNDSHHARTVSKLDHACYLGREFARAELALITGDEYVQD